MEVGSQDTSDVAANDGDVDVESFEDAYERLWPAAVRLARLLTGSSSVAEDLAQDAFVAVQGRWADVRNPDAYVRTAVVNRVRTYARRGSPPEEAHGTLVVTGMPEIDETWALLLGLSERQRAALVLRYYCDLPLAEIADLLGCRVGTIKSTIHRGLERLREEMS